MPLDLGVLGHQQLLAGDDVGAGLADDRRRSSVIEYDASTRSTLPSSRKGSRLSEIVSTYFDLVVSSGSMPRLGDQDLGHLDVEAGRDVGGRVLEAEAGLVVLHADLIVPASASSFMRVPSSKLVGGVLLDLDVRALGVIARVTAGGQRQGQAATAMTALVRMNRICISSSGPMPSPVVVGNVWVVSA